jgi:hypothetical protein
VASPTPHSQHRSHSDSAVSGTHLQLNLPHLGSLSVGAAPSPTPHSHGRWPEHSDDAISESQLQLAPPPYPPSIPQMASPVYAQSQQQQDDRDQPPLEAPTPTTRPSGPSSPTLDSAPPQDLVGRRAPASEPKRRCITRAVQPLACYFCRGQKIACGPPTNPHSGNRTCEYVVRSPQTIFLKLCFVCLFISNFTFLLFTVFVPACPGVNKLDAYALFPLVLNRPCARRQLVCEYPAESYRGRRSPGSKAAASVRPQQR